MKGERRRARGGEGGGQFGGGFGGKGSKRDKKKERKNGMWCPEKKKPGEGKKQSAFLVCWGKEKEKRSQQGKTGGEGPFTQGKSTVTCLTEGLVWGETKMGVLSCGGGEKKIWQARTWKNVNKRGPTCPGEGLVSTKLNDWKKSKDMGPMPKQLKTKIGRGVGARAGGEEYRNGIGGEEWKIGGGRGAKVWVVGWLGERRSRKKVWGR